jgi:hypothetical protein
MVAASSLGCVGRSQRLVSGRARQLAVLREKRQRSTYGELRVALVLSDPGLGQTWLAAELVPHSAEFPVALLAHRAVCSGACRRSGRGLTLLACVRVGPTVIEPATSAEVALVIFPRWCTVPAPPTMRRRARMLFPTE